MKINVTLLKYFMKKSTEVFLLFLFLSFSQYQLYAQNTVNSYEIISQDSSLNQIKLCLNNGSEILLETRYDNSSIITLNYLVEKNYCLVSIEPKSNYQEYIINAAYFYNNEWVQDYTDHLFFIPNTGISCTSINSLKLLNATSFLVNGSTITTWGNSDWENTIQLGKYGFFDCAHESSLSLRFGKDQDRSIRVDFLNLSRTQNH